jgi:hypothetical protein
LHRTASLVAASALVVAAGLVFGLGSCNAVLGLDAYGDVAQQMCGLLDRCYDNSETGRCLTRTQDYFTDSPPEAQAAWLEEFTRFSCLESCGAGRNCLNIPPLCSPSGSCEQRQECCGFLDGNADCVTNTCCATRGSACQTSDDCCAGTTPCKDGVCGGIACLAAEEPCRSDAACCTRICKGAPKSVTDPDGVCAKTICQDDKGDCAVDSDCCKLHCDTATRLCGPASTCGKPDEACSVDPDCCPGTHCLIPQGQIEGVCSSAACSEALVDCSAETPCCSGNCDPFAFYCAPACLGAGSKCDSEGKCCTGVCDAGHCTGTCSTGFCNGDADCCDGSLCLGHACTAACNPRANHDPCTVGAPIAPTQVNQACLVAVCTGDNAYCCCGAWDDLCVEAAVANQNACSGLCH